MPPRWGLVAFLSTFLHRCRPAGTKYNTICKWHFELPNAKNFTHPLMRSGKSGLETPPTRETEGLMPKTLHTLAARRYALALDMMLAEQARVLSDQEPSLKRPYCSWVKLGSVRKPNLPGLGIAKLVTA